MFNPLEINKQDIEQLFDLSATTVLVNDKPTKAFITEQNFFRETEDKHIHTLEPITTGDHIVYKGHDYYIINETVTKRHNKYKAIIRHCNYTVTRKNLIGRKLIGEGHLGQPEYENIFGEDYVIPTITSQRTFSIDERYAIRVIDKAVIVSVQDNELNRKSLFAINEVFRVKGKLYKVINHERSVKGILSIWGESVSEGQETVPKPLHDVPIIED